jgi:hypothetical protein
MLIDVDLANGKKDKPSGYIISQKAISIDNFNAPIEIPYSRTFVNKEEHLFLSPVTKDWKMRTYFASGDINHDLPFYNPDVDGLLSSFRSEKETALNLYNFLNGYQLDDMPEDSILNIRPPFSTGSEITTGHLNRSGFFRPIKYPAEELSGIELIKTVAAIKLLLLYRKVRNKYLRSEGFIDPAIENPDEVLTDLSMLDISSTKATIFRTPDMVQIGVSYGQPVIDIYTNRGMNTATNDKDSIMYLRKLVSMYRGLYNYLSKISPTQYNQFHISPFKAEQLIPHRWWHYPFFLLPMDYTNNDIDSLYRNNQLHRKQFTNKALFLIPHDTVNEPGQLVDSKLVSDEWNGSNMAFSVFDGHLYYSKKVSDTITDNLSIVGAKHPPKPIIDIYVICSESVNDTETFHLLNNGQIYETENYSYRVVITERNNWSRWNSGANLITPYPEVDRRLGIIDTILGMIKIYGGQYTSASVTIETLKRHSNPVDLLNSNSFIKRIDGSVESNIPFVTTLELIGYKSSNITDKEIESGNTDVIVIPLRSITPTDDAFTNTLKNERVRLNHISTYSTTVSFISPDNRNTMFVSKPGWLNLSNSCKLETCLDTIKAFIDKYRGSFPRLTGNTTAYAISTSTYIFNEPEWFKETPDGTIESHQYSKEFVELNRLSPIKHLVYGMRYSGRKDAEDVEFYPVSLHELSRKDTTDEDPKWIENISTYSEYLRGIAGETAVDQLYPEDISLINKENYKKLLAISKSDNSTIDQTTDVETLKITRKVNYDRIRRAINNLRIGVAATYVFRYNNVS